MKLFRLMLCALLASLLLGMVEGAKAQLGLVASHRVDSEDLLAATPTDPNKPQAVSGNKRYGSLGLYPFAGFARAGLLAGGGAGTATKLGGLLTADFGLRPANARYPLEVGGWYWNGGNADLYQIHARAFVLPSVALQVAYLNSGKVDSNSYTLFAIYELSSRRLQPKTIVTNPWVIQFGAGLLIDASGGTSTTDFTGFTQGSLRISGNLSVNASAWYLRDRTADLTRFTLGLGYAF